MQQVDAHTVARWFLWRASQERPARRVSNAKLQKLVYYAQAWHLAEVGDVLFPESIEAWIHGPVVPELYREFRRFGDHPIVIAEGAPMPLLNGDLQAYLEEVWDVYGPYDASYLETLTHQESPWQLAREAAEFDPSGSLEIDHVWMRDYYRALNEDLASRHG